MTKFLFFVCLVLNCFLFLGCATTSVEKKEQVGNTVELSSDVITEQKQIQTFKSYVECKADEVIVYIFIDSQKENIKNRVVLEATAMLRTKNYLRKEFPSLPKNYSIPSRRLQNSFDEEIGIYTYITSFQLKDIKARLRSEE